MLIDARFLPKDETVEAEVCIVGAGPAGITLARELIGRNFRVCLLESGGLNLNPETQLLGSSESETIGEIEYPTAQSMRQRQLGGTANVWSIDMAGKKAGIRYVPFEKIDFEKRDWVPHSGWPFDRSHLDPYYERAQKVCQIGPYSYEVKDWQDEQASPLNLGDQVTTRMFQVGSREVFTHEYMNEFRQADNVTVYFNATAVELETNETAQTVTRVKVSCLHGPQFWVAAKFVILAQGAVDNARLLLLSDQVQKTGLGNQHDVVGRFLMDHSIVRAGTLVPTSRDIFNKTSLYDLRRVRDAFVIGQMSLSENVLRREKLLHITTSLFPAHPIYKWNLRRLLFPQGKGYHSAAIKSSIELKRALRRGKLPPNALKKLGQMITGLDDIVYFLSRKDGGFSLPLPKRYGYDDNGWSSLPDRTQRFGLFEVINLTEQAPDPNNRVMLGTELDGLGCRKPLLHWQWNEIDRKSIVRTQKILAEEFARAGLGQLKLELDKGDPQAVRFSAHHCMGTTRMHEDPKQGVVDSDCRVHGVSNLFITGMSVFPTGSYANPTLTIIAMAIRTADHIKELLERESAVTLTV